MNPETPIPFYNSQTPPSQSAKVPASGHPRQAPTFRLYKRDYNGHQIQPGHPDWATRDYYFRVQIRGQSYSRCLGTQDPALAQRAARQKAVEIKEAIIRGDLAAVAKTKTRQTAIATIDQLLAAYETCNVDASAKTRRNNIGAFRAVLEASQITDFKNTTVDKINAALVRKFFAAAQERALQLPNQGEQASLKRGANSRCNQARSLFIPKAIALYQDLGIYHPALRDFAEAYAIHKFGRLPTIDYNPPGDAIIQKTLQAWEAIEDRDLFMAIGHELAFGLRAGELAQAKWNWWTIRQGYPVLDATATVKNGTGLIQVRALDPFFTLMRSRAEAQAWRAKPDDYIITGTLTNRSDAIFRVVSEFLRTHKWETKKTNHALRAYAGSQIAMKYGIYEAANWLRHSTVKVTEQHYSHFIRTFKPANTDDLPVYWAAHNTAPILRVVTGNE